MWWGFVVFTVGRRSLLGFSTSGWRFHVFLGVGIGFAYTVGLSVKEFVCTIY